MSTQLPLRGGRDVPDSEVRGLPLRGVRVLDLATLLAAPFGAELLGDFGAEVIKVELPGVGDPMRFLEPHREGVPLWWKVVSRNKQSITLDVRKPRGREVLLRLVERSDALVENFRPGTLERWGLGPQELLRINPGLVILRTTGFGQTGPYAGQPGFGRVAETLSGLAGITGYPDRPPLHAPFPLGDMVSGLFGALGVMIALYHRDAQKSGRGQVVDLGLYEAVFRLLEVLPAEYDQLGIVRERAGNRNPSVAPLGVFQTGDGRWVSMVASSQAVCERLFRAMGGEELVADPRFRTMKDRLDNVDALEALMAEWIGRHTLAEVREIFTAGEVPFAPVYTIADVFQDPQFAARENIIEVTDPELGKVRMPGVVPRLSETPGRVRSAGPALGAHTDTVLRDIGGYTEEELASLRNEGVI